MSIFEKVSVPKQRRNAFDLSHEKKLTCKMGELIPVLCQEVLPGDKFTIKTEALVRLQPLLAPAMHRVDVTIHNFFVPNRLIWDNWEKYITGGEDGLDASIIPSLTIEETKKDYFASGTLADYLGVPIVDPTKNIHENGELLINALPFKAYQEIYNEYYRDQNLEEPVDYYQSPEEMILRTRAWEKDYFTSALPWAQRGAEVTLPLGTEAPVLLDTEAVQTGAGNQRMYDISLTEIAGDVTTDANGLLNTNGLPSYLDPDGTMKTDLTNATAITIEDLRRATRLQEWLERNARAGSRYIESILSHFGVVSSDSRLQRPEYLGGTKQAVVISEVLASVGLENAPQGTMTGHGVSVGGGKPITRRFEEHGFIMAIMSVTPRSSYMQGVPKMFLRRDKLDFYWPEFSQLGEQEVKMNELYHEYYTDNQNDDTFGYQSRYAEYKQNPNQVAGEMRTNLSFWHFGRRFDQQPVLNNSFVKCVPTEAPWAVQDPSVDDLIIQLHHGIKAIRPMPYFNIPNL